MKLSPEAAKKFEELLALIVTDKAQSSSRHTQERAVLDAARLRAKELHAVASAASRLQEMGLYEEAVRLANKSGATLPEVFSPCRLAHVALARRKIMLLLRRRMNWSFHAIGELFDRDHSTVVASVKKAEREEEHCFVCAATLIPYDDTGDEVCCPVGHERRTK